ncbi:mitochondrial dicarboxylate carrier isoform X1 [Austrofundulus limnaeus]|uniref:Mitochondrial dicarboxylate carrier isoform X1 n=1 Tax=Austrofundulus limnaeus TaxID=52670 RepID=A0A2I4CKY4_AUSLI|nr:PREDICTED: mitochondrial dicarboxylate carrier isoform X1 [Austrofundulus limnaeus]
MNISSVSFSYNMQENRVSRWYFGGVSSSAAACLTHPLDLIKVHLQTQQEVRVRMIGMTVNVVRREGYLALYSGLSASLCRQMTYSLSRFAIYETIRDRMHSKNKGLMPFYQKVLLGAFGGFTGGLIGTPADLVNVRMQNDVKLPAELKRSYAHVLDGLIRVWKEEGIFKLFSGATMASTRGALVSIGQLSCYDQSKQLVLATGWVCYHPVPTTGRCQNTINELKVGIQECVSLPDRNSKARPEGVLQGSRSSSHSPHPSNGLHLHIPRAAEAALWSGGRHLRTSEEGLAALLLLDSLFCSHSENGFRV